MKSKIVVILILCLILIGCGYGLYTMVYVDDDNDDAVVVVNNMTNTVRSEVYSDYLENNISMDGVVINKRGEENYTLSLEVKPNENVLINCEIGMEVSTESVIFTVGSKEYKSEVSGIVIDILNEKDYVSVTILDYDMLCIVAKINYAYRDKMFIGKKISVCETNPLSSKEKHVETIKSIGYLVESDMMDVFLTNNLHYLPGTTLKCEFKFKDKVKSLYVLKKMVLEDASGKYVYVENNGKREKRIIEVGKEFSVSSDGEFEVAFKTICAILGSNQAAPSATDCTT